MLVSATQSNNIQDNSQSGQDQNPLQTADSQAGVQ